MLNRYFIVFGLLLELTAAMWLIGNSSSHSDAMLAFFLHLIAAMCFAAGASSFQHFHARSGRLAIFFLSLLLPLVGPLIFAILTSSVGREADNTTPEWQVIEPPQANTDSLSNNQLSATALRALVKHSRNAEVRLEALNKTTRLGPHSARPILQAALSDDSELVRKTAFELLEGRNTNVHVEIGSLLEVMDKNPDSLNDTNIQAEAASQLWELAYQGFADTEAIEGFLQRANAHLHRAMNDEEPSAELHFQRARIQLKLNQPAAARIDFERALHLGQSLDEIAPYLAECAFNEGKYEQVLPCLRRLTPIRQNSGRFNNVLNMWVASA